MSYEQSPATALVATACCVCGRALVEAESIASGIGPVCAEKTGFGRASLDAETRAEVNRLVYELAALQRSPGAWPRLDRLRALGFDVLADKIADRLGTAPKAAITIAPHGAALAVRYPFVEDRDAFLALKSSLFAIRGFKLENADGGKVATIPNDRACIHALYKALSRVFAGSLTRSPKGLFVLPTETEIDAAFAARRTS